MPCSGLKRSLSLRPGTAAGASWARTSIVLRPCASRPVWLVSRPNRKTPPCRAARAASGAKSSCSSTSMPVSDCSVAVLPSALARDGLVVAGQPVHQAPFIGLASYPRGHRIGHCAANGIDPGRSIGIHSVRHEDDVGIAGGIHPDGGSGEPCMAKRAHRKQLAAVAGVGRFDIPAEPAQRSAGSRLLRRGHLFQRELQQREMARLAGKPVEQVLRVDGDVAGSAEDPGMPGNPAHAPRGWIVDHSPQHDAMIVLGGRSAAAPAFRRQISHVLHTPAVAPGIAAGIGRG